MSTPQQGRKEVCVFSVSQNEEVHCSIFLPPVGDAHLHLVCVAVCVCNLRGFVCGRVKQVHSDKGG